MVQASLTFIEGQFFLADPPTTKFSDAWVKIDNRTFVTRNLKAAAEYRRFTDVTCERVFNRAFNIEYDLPTLPPLKFLDPHQIDGVKWVLSRKRSYLAHATRCRQNSTSNHRFNLSSLRKNADSFYCAAITDRELAKRD